MLFTKMLFHCLISNLCLNKSNDVSKKDWDLLPRVLPSLQLLLTDSSPQVQKRVIQAFNIVYRNILGWVAKSTAVTDDMSGVWNIQSNIKKMIVDMVDSENDG